MNTEYKDIDVFNTLAEYIDNILKDKDNKTSIGVLHQVNSLNIKPLAGGKELSYYDGSREKQLNVQIESSNENMEECYKEISVLMQELDNVENIKSDNGSYEFRGIEITGYPFIVTTNEKRTIMGITLKIKIYVYGGY